MSAGVLHTLAIKSDGTLWAWGRNSNGQLGDSSNTDKNTPTQIGTDTKWVSVSSGAFYTVGLKSDGTLWAWGYNGYGELGDGTNTNKNTPTQIGTDTRWVSMSVGNSHTVALKSDGSLWTWGRNSEGQLGDGSNTQRNAPTQISTQIGVVALQRGGGSANYSAIIKDTRSSICLTGSNINGQLGNGNSGSGTNTNTFNCANSVCATYNLATTATTYNSRPLAGTGNRTDFQLGCTLASSLMPSGASPVAGTVTSKVFIDPSVQTTAGGTPYVQRHYDIEPATNASTATATLMLYFTQADFTAFNAARGSLPALPVDAADGANNKANLRVTQFHGVPTNGNAPSNYPATWSGSGPARVLITPTSVVWDEANQWWTVTFPVTGFSGFFISSNQAAPLPVRLLAFTAKAQGSANVVSWNTASETEGITYEVTRSGNGSSFAKLGSVAGKAKGSDYSFYDEAPLEGVNYYRLNITEPSGEQTQSTVAIVRRSGGASGSLSVWPVPASSSVSIATTNASLLGSQVVALDMQGRVMTTAVVSAATKIDVQGWPAGIYTLKFEDGTVVKVVKQ